MLTDNILDNVASSEVIIIESQKPNTFSGISSDTEFLKHYFQKNGYTIKVIPEKRKWKKILAILGIFEEVKIQEANEHIIVFTSPTYKIVNDKSHFRVLRVHDLFPLTNKKWFNLASKLYFKRVLSKHLKQANLILFNSQNSLREYIRHFKTNPQQFDILEYEQYQSISTTPCNFCPGCKNEFETSKIFLSVGTFEQRKNYRMLLNTWRRMKESISCDCLLICVGTYKWRRIRNYIEYKLIKHKSSVMTSVCDYQLNELFKKSKGYITFSFKEGFNIPFNRAIEHKKPILASRIEAHFLKKQKLITFVDPNDKTGCFEKLVEFHETNCN